MATIPFHSTPPRPTLRGYNQYSSKSVLLAKARRKQLRENMDGYFLGPMDPTEFMVSFMPANSQGLGVPPDGVHFGQLYNQAAEKSMHAPFVSHHFSPPSGTVLIHTELNRWPLRTRYAPTTWRGSLGVDSTPRRRSNLASCSSPKTTQEVLEKTRMQSPWSLRFSK